MGNLSGRPTYYARARAPVWEDEIDIYIVYAFAACWVIFSCLIPRYIHEKKQWNWVKFLGGTVMILIGCFNMLGIYALHWEVGEIEVENYPYTAHTKEVCASVI